MAFDVGYGIACIFTSHVLDVKKNMSNEMNNQNTIGVFSPFV